MADGIIIILLLITLLFIGGLYGRFAQGPESVRQLAREEIDKARAEGESKAYMALREEAAKQASTLLDGIKLFHDQLGERLRDEIKASEARARAAERATADVATALEAATALVRELRGSLDERRGAKPAELSPPDDPDARETIDMPGPKPPLAKADDEPEEELTQVTKRPIAGTHAAPNGLRLVPARAAIPPPPVAASAEGRAKR